MISNRKCGWCSAVIQLKNKGQTKRFCDRRCSQSKWYEDNRERLRKYFNDYLHQHQDVHTEINRKWRIKRPDGQKAHNVVSKAVRTNRLKKQPCEVCGNEKVHAHHDDYSRKLDVKWLCPLHHKQLHKERKLQNV